MVELAELWSKEGEFWYEVGYASSARSKCKEFRCKQTIEKDELRIGIVTEESDHAGSNFGWFHPACLWRTFVYRRNANRPITATKDLKGFDALKNEDKKKIEDFIKGGTPSPTATTASSTASPAAGSPAGPGMRLTLLMDDASVLHVAGDTFHIKELMKAHSGKWNGKCWDFFAKSHHEPLLKALGVPAATTSEGKSLRDAMAAGPTPFVAVNVKKPPQKESPEGEGQL